MLEVRDNQTLDRYELDEDGSLVGFVSYRRRQGETALTHAEVRRERRNQGLGAVMVAGALDDLRARGDRVIPVCGYVAAYMRDHPEVAPAANTPGDERRRVRAAR